MNSVEQQVRVLRAIKDNPRRDLNSSGLGFGSGEQFYNFVKQLKENGLLSISEQSFLKVEKRSSEHTYTVFLNSATLTPKGNQFLDEHE